MPHSNIKINLSIYLFYATDHFNKKLKIYSDECLSKLKNIIELPDTYKKINETTLFKIECTFEQFHLIRNTLMNFQLKMIKIDYQWNIVTIQIRLEKNTPLLSFCGFNINFIGTNTETIQVECIMENYENNFSKKDILLCQKELIDKGFAGNASW